MKNKFYYTLDDVLGNSDLTKRERVVFELRFIEKKKFREIAKSVGVCNERARQIYQGSLYKLSDNIKIIKELL